MLRADCPNLYTVITMYKTSRLKTIFFSILVTRLDWDFSDIGSCFIGSGGNIYMHEVSTYPEFITKSCSKLIRGHSSTMQINFADQESFFRDFKKIVVNSYSICLVQIRSQFKV